MMPKTEDLLAALPARSASIALPLDAPVETVWRAITDPQELVHWFPTNAAVDSRPGGAFVISWDGLWQWEMTITDLEPMRRLRMIERQARPFDANGRPLDTEAPVEMALEIALEPAGSGTILRLVHSGFGHGAAWDDELDGVTLGWNVELRSLRHYLAHHRGRTRRTAQAHATSPRALGELWEMLTATSGLIVRGYSPALAEGEACALELSTGDRIDGHVTFAQPGRQLVVATEGFGNGLFRLSLDRADGKALIQVWLSTWTIDPALTSAFEARVRRALAQLIPGA